MHYAAVGVCRGNPASAGALFQSPVVRILAVTGITDGGNPAPDFLQPLFLRLPSDAVRYLTRLFFGVGHMSGITLSRAVTVFNLLEQGFDTLLYVGIGRSPEPLGVTAPSDTTPCGA